MKKKPSVQRNAKADPAAAPVSVSAPLEIVAPESSALSVEKQAKVADYAAQITSNLQSASLGLRAACLLAYKASEDGCFSAVMDALKASGNFSDQTLYGLQTTVERVFPFVLQNGGSIEQIGNVDGMRTLLPSLAKLDKVTGKFSVIPGREEIVKRALSGEPPRALALEIKGANPKKGGGGKATPAQKRSNAHDDVRDAVDVLISIGTKKEDWLKFADSIFDSRLALSEKRAADLKAKNEALAAKKKAAAAKKAAKAKPAKKKAAAKKK